MSELVLRRIRSFELGVLQTLEQFDQEAFGPLGLRLCDLVMLSEAGAVFAAEYGSQIIGGCQVVRTLDNPACFYVVGFYVRPSWQRRGLGRVLLQRILGEIRQLGAEEVILTVAPGNRPAVALYEGAGFQVERTQANLYGLGEDRLIMRLRFVADLTNPV